MPQKTTNKQQNKYISPKNLAERWDCSRSSVDRIALRGNLKKLILGTGKNGSVRYLLEEVETYERKQTI